MNEPHWKYVTDLTDQAHAFTASQVKVLAMTWDATPRDALWRIARQYAAELTRGTVSRPSRMNDRSAAQEIIQAIVREKGQSAVTAKEMISACAAARSAAQAAIVRDVLPDRYRDALYGPWNQAVADKGTQDSAVQQRIQDLKEKDSWTAQEVADYLGYASTLTARSALSRWGIRGTRDEGGQFSYPAQGVIEAAAKRPGKGFRKSGGGAAKPVQTEKQLKAKDLWTTRDVADYLGYRGPKRVTNARSILHRSGIRPVKTGSVAHYSAQEVRAWKSRSEKSKRA